VTGHPDIARFIDNACPYHNIRGRPSHDIARFIAQRMLEKDPALARASFETAIVCGDVERVRRELDSNPSLACAKGGSKEWEPLLYLAFTRLDLPASRDNAVAIAQLLLDRGADPNVSFKAGDSDYTPLVGAVGEGEEDRPPHARRDELVRLFLEHGAAPYDMQVVYNIHFHGNVLWWLKLMHEYSVRCGCGDDWADPEWQMLKMGRYGSGARWHYWIAIEHDDLPLATWCAEHGATPNAAPADDPRFSKRSLYQDALFFDRPAIADLLARHGATRAPLTGEDAFLAACRRGDRAEAARLVAADSHVLISTRALEAAARENRANMLALLMELGADPNATDVHAPTALHTAAYHGSVDAAKFLIERGAQVDAVEMAYQATPLGWAIHAGRRDTIALLARHSRDVHNLVYSGNLARVRAVLDESPELVAKRSSRDDETPLMWLPNDDARAAELAQLLIDHGADPGATNRSGKSAAAIAEQRQLDRAANVIRAAHARSA
jgi:ankyrin repeat protein